MEEFVDLDVEVQLQLLTATVKLFLKKPATSQATVKEVLQVSAPLPDILRSLVLARRADHFFAATAHGPAQHATLSKCLYG